MDCLRRAGYHLVICSVRLLNAAAVAAQRRIDVTGWLCAFAIGAVLGVWVFTGLDAIRVREPVPLTGRWVLGFVLPIVPLFILSYTVCYFRSTGACGGSRHGPVRQPSRTR